MDRVAHRAKIPLSGLYRRMAKEQLNLLTLATGSPTEFSAGAASVMRRDARLFDCLGIHPEHLPYELLA